MAIRQEQIVFGFAVLLTGYFVWSGSGTTRVAPERTNKLDYERSIVPEAPRALPMPKPGSAVVRDLLREPTNARPMPMLEFQAPPLSDLPLLSPLPPYAPAAVEYGRVFRRDVNLETIELVAGLFDGTGSFDDLGEAETEDGNTLDALRELGLVAEEDELIEEAPNRVQLLASYKELYDWILLDEFDYHFGSIDNPGRYRLIERPAEDVKFSEVDPSTGAARFVGQGTVEYPRARVTAFGFAATQVNRVELGAIEREGPITRGNMAERLAFADECVVKRHAAPRGLEVARDLYRRVAEFEPGDPTARLGLARCLEVSFAFDEAFAEYEVLTQAFPSNAKVAAAYARLEERFFLYYQAETRLRRAVAKEPGSYAGHWALGSFLLRNGGAPELVREELEKAQRYAPDTPEATSLRARIRVDVGRAALQTLELDRAKSAFAGALNAENLNQDALAGLFQVAILQRALGQSATPPSLPDELISLEGPLLLARGLWNLDSGNWLAAKLDLEAAVLAMPLDPSLALCALSSLAERTGHLSESMDYTDRALDVKPGMPWALFQRGRLQYQRDDWQGAEDSLRAALGGEVDFVDAAVLLGQIAMEDERYDDAERYFDRVRRLEPPRLDVEARRGLNALLAGDVQQAMARFEEARGLSQALDPVVSGGLAWCYYAREQGEEALNRFAALDDARRDFGDDDPWREWSRAQAERIQEQMQMERWVDEFDRKSLRNDWFIEEGAGPLVDIREEALKIEGQFNQNGEVRVYRRLPALRFVAIEADLMIGSSTAGRAGLFVARESRGARRTVTAMVNAARHKDGSLQTHVVRSGRPDDGPQDVTWLGFPTDQVVRLRIERSGDDSDAVVNVYVDGTPVLQSVPMSSFGRTQSDLSLGFFVEGDSGRRVELTVDNVEIVRRKS